MGHISSWAQLWAFPLCVRQSLPLLRVSDFLLPPTQRQSPPHPPHPPAHGAIATRPAPGHRHPSKLAVSGLRGAATALEEVESEGRTRAVSGLLGAATALQAVLGVGLDNLRDAAADLARQ